MARASTGCCYNWWRARRPSNSNRVISSSSLAIIRTIGLSITSKNPATQGGSADEEDQVVETARRIRETILRWPRWESSLLSLFAPSRLFHLTCIRLILRPLASSRPLLSLRYLLWLSSHHDASPLDAPTASSLLDALGRAWAWRAALLTLHSTKCCLDTPALDSFLLRLLRYGVIDNAIEAILEFGDHPGFFLSLPTWNAALSASLRAGRIDAVCRLYQTMMRYSIAGMRPPLATSSGPSARRAGWQRPMGSSGRSPGMGLRQTWSSSPSLSLGSAGMTTAARSPSSSTS